MHVLCAAGLRKNGLWPASASEHTHQGAASWWRASSLGGCCCCCCCCCAVLCLQLAGLAAALLQLPLCPVAAGCWCVAVAAAASASAASAAAASAASASAAAAPAVASPSSCCPSFFLLPLLHCRSPCSCSASLQLLLMWCCWWEGRAVRAQTDNSVAALSSPRGAEITPFRRSRGESNSIFLR